MTAGVRVLHLVSPGPPPRELASPPPGHTVAALPGPDAGDAEWDRLLELILTHEVVVTW